MAGDEKPYTVLRGSLEEGSFAYYYFAPYHGQDRLTGVLAVDRPDAERTPMQSLAEAQPSYGEVADDLRDADVDLAELVDKEPATFEAEEAELSFADDIRGLFCEKDVDEMKAISGFDMSSYDDVQEWPEGIYARLVDGSMPCDEPWPDERLAKFKWWMDQGMQP